MRIVIELKRGDPKVVLNQLFVHSPLQTTFGDHASRSSTAPQTLTLRELINALPRLPAEVVAPSKYDLGEAERRAHILEGLKIALDDLDAVIALIRAAKDVGPRAGLQPPSSSPRSRPTRSSKCACRDDRARAPARSSRSTSGLQS